MALCQKCRKFFPPGYVEDEKGLCIFCEQDRDKIYYDFGNKIATRDEIVKEYREYLAKLNESIRESSAIPSIPTVTDAEDIRRTSIS
jgi:hypothetical protein